MGTLDKRPGTIANLFEQQWRTRSPLPSLITFDKRKQFIGEDFEKVQSEYDQMVKRATTPQTNSTLERIHLTIIILRTFESDKMELEKKDPFVGILAETTFAIHST